MVNEMPNLQSPDQSQGLSPSSLRPGPLDSQMHELEMQAELPDSRGPDYYEAQNIKWNTARIVRLSSGNYALLSPFNEGAIDLIKVGTLEEIAGAIPTYDECVAYCERTASKPIAKRAGPRGTAELLADIGL